jgi:hypothetical protein
VHGGEIADRGQQVGYHFALCLGNGHGGRRWFVVGEELRDHLGAERVEANESAHQHR